MTEHRVELPEGFEEYAHEVEAKGWLQGTVAIIDGRRYALTFYDPTRLSQDIAEELRRGAFFEPNLIVVRSVTRPQIESSVAAIVATGRHNLLAPLDAENPSA